MKATNIHARFVGLALGTMTLAASVASLVQAQEAPIATNAPAAEPSTAQPLAPAEPTAQQATNAPAEQQPPAAAAEQKPAVVQAPADLSSTNTAVATTLPNGEKGVLLNFRDAPLDLVLNYLSDAAGFVINIAPGTDLRVKVTVLSGQPASKEDAIKLLNSVLSDNNLQMTHNGNVLTIKSREAGINSESPVRRGEKPEEIPATAEMVTYIIPVRYANALQLTRDLQPLLPGYAKMTANESANSLVLTATQADVHRMVEIVSALDTSISSISTIRVFPLKYADAKQLADAVTQLFQSPASAQNNNTIQRGFRGGRGGGGNPFAAMFNGGGGGGGGSDPTQGTGDNVARQAASTVKAIGDDRTNSLIISAPDDYIATIEQLVKDVDVSVTDLTEVRVFHLEHADPQELVTQLTQLFPDPTKSGQNQQGQQVQFRGGGRGGQRGGAPAATTQAATSDRMKKMGQVLAVADPRTASVIVSAASDLMPQIAEMVASLDADASGKQVVGVISLENQEPSDILAVLQDLYPSGTQNRNTSRSQQQQNTAIQTRTQNNNSNQGRNTTTGTAGRGGTGGMATTGF